MLNSDRAIIVAVIAVLAVAASAAETVNYTYDAQGQLLKVVRKGGVNDGAVTTYDYDNAANITNKTTTGAPK